MQKIFRNSVVMDIMKTYSIQFAGVCLIDICEYLSFYVAYRCHSK